MPKKPEPIKIAQVTYTHTGTDGDFSKFLKAIIHDYLADETTPPEQTAPKKTA